MKRLSLLLLLFCCVSQLVACGDEDEADTKLAKVEIGEELPGGETTNQLLFGSNAYIKPASNLDDESLTFFFTGNSFFNQNWIETPASPSKRDGLGPLFNSRSCSGCHFKDGRGRPALEEGEAHQGLLVRLSIPGTDDVGGPLPDPNYGGQIQDFSVNGVPAEATVKVVYEEVPGTYGDGTSYTLLKPTYSFENLAYGDLHPDVLTSPRVAPAMIGLGLLEAIPGERLLALADVEDSDKDGISGRVNMVWDVRKGDHSVGRFGWKAEHPTVEQQSAGAFLGDIGITSSLFPSQNCTTVQDDCLNTEQEEGPELEDHLLRRVTVYGQALAVPKRRVWKTPEILRGKKLFTEAGCASCHTPSHQTGDFEELPAMANQKIWPYTDLLLHDMGEGLADNRPLFDATGTEWKTPPLWGLGLVETVNKHDRLLHDGRARGFAEAILWHGGEGEKSKEAFRNMPEDDRNALITFLESL